MVIPSSQLVTEQIISAVSSLSLPELERAFVRVLALQAERKAAHLSATGYQAMHEAPNVAGYLLSITRVARQLAPQMLDRVTPGVANALPSSEAEATGLHPLPTDPLDALVFVGTRYAVRTTDAMVTAVRNTYGYGDPELTDLFYAIAMRNGLERMQRLLTALPSTT